jgi:hypothetical protein
MQAPEYDGDTSVLSARHISDLLSDDQCRVEQGEEASQQLDQAFSQEVDTTPPTIQNFCVSASEKKPSSIGGDVRAQKDNKLTIIHEELSDQRTSIINQGYMIKELAKTIDSSNTSIKSLTETVQAFFTTFQVQNSHSPDVLVSHPAKTTSSESNSENTSKEAKSTLPSFKPDSFPGSTTNYGYQCEVCSHTFARKVNLKKHMDRHKVYIASQRRAENPLLPTPNFGWYESVREEAHYPHYLGRSAGRPTKPSWLAQSRHQSASPAPSARQPRQTQSRRPSSQPQRQNGSHSDYRPHTGRQQYVPAYPARGPWHGQPS